MIGQVRDLNGHQEEGFTLHWGYLIVGIALAVGAVIILLALGWRWLWLVPAAAVGLFALGFVSSLFEGRWLAVTPEHVRRGVPATCSECGAEWDLVIGATGFKTRCPIRGHRERGHLLDS